MTLETSGARVRLAQNLPNSLVRLANASGDAWMVAYAAAARAPVAPETSGAAIMV